MERAFAEFIGKRFWLSGVDMGRVPPVEPYDEAANTILFILDNETWLCQEDPSDGYRSSMKSLERVDGFDFDVQNKFAAVLVQASHDVGDGNDDILEFLDVESGLVVLQVGTANTDDYYPSYVGNWIPSHLAVNRREIMAAEARAAAAERKKQQRRDEERIRKAAVVQPTARRVELPD